MAKETKPSWGTSLVVFCVGLLVILICFAKCQNKKEPVVSESVEVASAPYWRVAAPCAASSTEENYDRVSQLSFVQDEEWWQLVRDKKAMMLPGGAKFDSVAPVSDKISKIVINGKDWYVSSIYLERFGHE